MWVATINPTVPVENGEEGPFWFASLDGEHYIGVNRKPMPEDETQIRQLLEGNGRFRPMTAAPRYLQFTAHQFYGTEPVFEEV